MSRTATRGRLPDHAMPNHALLIDSLATELERARPLPAQVTKHISGNYSVERDAIGAFLVDELPKLEDYEIDLTLSPAFTPALHDQAIFAAQLGGDAVPATEWPALIQALVARPTRATLLTEDGQSHRVPLRDVTIERFVNRLRLGATISPALLELIASRIPQSDQPIFKAIARRAVWESEPRCQILRRFVEATASSDAEKVDDAISLLKLVETYEPIDAADLIARIPHWEQVLRHEISLASNPKPFFNERVQELHGGGRDQRRQDQAQPKQDELAFLARLRRVLGG